LNLALLPATELPRGNPRCAGRGAVLIGKTTLCEFGWKGVCDSPLTGIGRTLGYAKPDADVVAPGAR